MSPLSGVGQYTTCGLAALMALMPETAFHLFLGVRWSRALPQDGGPAMGAGGMMAAVADVARRLGPARAAWHRYCRLRFVSRVRALAPDLLYATNYLPPGPVPRSVPVVPVIYDLSHMRMPEAHPAQRVRRLGRLAALAPDAPAVVTISAFSKREIVALLGVAEDNVIVAPPGVSPAFGPVDPVRRRAVLAAHGLEDGRYVLAVGNLEPRKNLRTLIAAYARLPAALRQRHPLALAGGAGWGDAGTGDATAADLRRAGELRLLGYAPGGHLPALYAGAAAFCFPSLYEGFGMPVVEAMACGAPVIASTAASVPEAAGDAGISCDPRDGTAWTEALRRVLEDGAYAAALRAAGPRQAARFTWEACAAKTREAFACCAAG